MYSRGPDRGNRNRDQGLRDSNISRWDQPDRDPRLRDDNTSRWDRDPSLRDDTTPRRDLDTRSRDDTAPRNRSNERYTEGPYSQRGWNEPAPTYAHTAERPDQWERRGQSQPDGQYPRDRHFDGYSTIYFPATGTYQTYNHYPSRQRHVSDDANSEERWRGRDNKDTSTQGFTSPGRKRPYGTERETRHRTDREGLNTAERDTSYRSERETLHRPQRSPHSRSERDSRERLDRNASSRTENNSKLTSERDSPYRIENSPCYQPMQGQDRERSYNSDNSSHIHSSTRDEMQTESDRNRHHQTNIQSVKESDIKGETSIEQSAASHKASLNNESCSRLSPMLEQNIDMIKSIQKAVLKLQTLTETKMVNTQLNQIQSQINKKKSDLYRTIADASNVSPSVMTHNQQEARGNVNTATGTANDTRLVNMTNKQVSTYGKTNENQQLAESHGVSYSGSSTSILETSQYSHNELPCTSNDATKSSEVLDTNNVKKYCTSRNAQSALDVDLNNDHRNPTVDSYHNQSGNKMEKYEVDTSSSHKFKMKDHEKRSHKHSKKGDEKQCASHKHRRKSDTYNPSSSSLSHADGECDSSMNCSYLNETGNEKTSSNTNNSLDDKNEMPSRNKSSHKHSKKGDVKQSASHKHRRQSDTNKPSISSVSHADGDCGRENPARSNTIHKQKSETDKPSSTGPCEQNNKSESVKPQKISASLKHSKKQVTDETCSSINVSLEQNRKTESETTGDSANLEHVTQRGTHKTSKSIIVIGEQNRKSESKTGSSHGSKDHGSTSETSKPSSSSREQSSKSESEKLCSKKRETDKPSNSSNIGHEQTKERESETVSNSVRCKPSSKSGISKHSNKSSCRENTKTGSEKQCSVASPSDQNKSACEKPMKRSSSHERSKSNSNKTSSGSKNSKHRRKSEKNKDYSSSNNHQLNRNTETGKSFNSSKSHEHSKGQSENLSGSTASRDNSKSRHERSSSSKSSHDNRRKESVNESKNSISNFSNSEHENLTSHTSHEKSVCAKQSKHNEHSEKRKEENELQIKQHEKSIQRNSLKDNSDHNKNKNANTDSEYNKSATVNNHVSIKEMKNVTEKSKQGEIKSSEAPVQKKDNSGISNTSERKPEIDIPEDLPKEKSRHNEKEKLKPLELDGSRKSSKTPKEGEKKHNKHTEKGISTDKSEGKRNKHKNTSHESKSIKKVKEVESIKTKHMSDFSEKDNNANSKNRKSTDHRHSKEKKTTEKSKEVEIKDNAKSEQLHKSKSVSGKHNKGQHEITEKKKDIKEVAKGMKPVKESIHKSKHMKKKTSSKGSSRTPASPFQDIDQFMQEIDMVLMSDEKPDQPDKVSTAKQLLLDNTSVISLSTDSDSDKGSNIMSKSKSSKVNEVKHFTKCDGKLFWKSVELKEPRVAIERLDMNKVFRKKNKEGKFKRIRTVDSQSSEEIVHSTSDSSDICRHVSVSKLKDKSPVIESDTEEAFQNEKQMEEKDLLSNTNVITKGVVRSISIDSNCTTRSGSSISSNRAFNNDGNNLNKNGDMPSEQNNIKISDCTDIPNEVKRTQSVDSNCSTRSATSISTGDELNNSRKNSVIGLCETEDTAAANINLTTLTTTDDERDRTDTQKSSLLLNTESQPEICVSEEDTTSLNDRRNVAGKNDHNQMRPVCATKSFQQGNTFQKNKKPFKRYRKTKRLSLQAKAGKKIIRPFSAPTEDMTESGEEADIEDNDITLIQLNVEVGGNTLKERDMHAEQENTPSGEPLDTNSTSKDTEQSAETLEYTYDTSEITGVKMDTPDLKEKDIQSANIKNTCKSEVDEKQTDLKCKKSSYDPQIAETRSVSTKANDTELETKIKNEPEWSLKGYTQEPDVIFLSDDNDEMIMSFSQPVINLDSDSDGEIQNSGTVRVKQETSDWSDEGSLNSDLRLLEFDSDIFSSNAESDMGSDFEPEAMFGADMLGRSDQNIIANENNALEPKQTHAHIESNVPTVKNEDESNRIANKEAALTEEGADLKSTVTDTKYKLSDIVQSAADHEFSSSGDEIIFSTAFYSPKPKDVKTKKQEIKCENDPYAAATQMPPKGVHEKSTHLDTKHSKHAQINLFPDKGENNMDSQDLYAQETQVDSEPDNQSDIDAFDFKSEHFTGTELLDEPASAYAAETQALTDNDIHLSDDPNDELYQMQIQVVMQEDEPVVEEQADSADSVGYSDISDTYVDPQLELYNGDQQIQWQAAKRFGIHVDYSFELDKTLEDASVSLEEKHKLDDKASGKETDDNTTDKDHNDNCDDEERNKYLDYDKQTQVSKEKINECDDDVYEIETQVPLVPDRVSEQLVEDSGLDSSFYEAQTLLDASLFENATQIDLTKDSSEQSDLNSSLYMAPTQLQKTTYETETQINLADDTLDEQLDDSDNDLYGAETQMFPTDFPELGEETLTTNDDRYDVLTQVDHIELSDGDDDPYIASTQIETTGAQILNKKDKYSTEKNKDFPKSNRLKRPNFVRDTEGFQKTVCPVPVKKKRTILQTEPQRLKSTAEKRSSGTLVRSRSENQENLTMATATTENSPQFPPPRSDIFIQNANKEDMWLSKDHAINKKTTTTTVGKSQTRKRRRTKSSENPAVTLALQMKEARLRLEERNFQSIVSPDSIADPAKRPKPSTTVAAPEYEDADLPTCSQIVNHGFPVLNETGVLLRKPAAKTSHTAGRFASRAAALTEAMLCTPVRPVKTSSVTTVTSTQTISTPAVSTSVTYSSSLSKQGTISTTATTSHSTLEKPTVVTSGQRRLSGCDKSMDKHASSHAPSRDKPRSVSSSSKDNYASSSSSSKAKHSSKSSSFKDKLHSSSKEKYTAVPCSAQGDREKRPSGSSSSNGKLSSASNISRNTPSSSSKDMLSSSSKGKHSSVPSSSRDTPLSSSKGKQPRGSSSSSRDMPSSSIGKHSSVPCSSRERRVSSSNIFKTLDSSGARLCDQSAIQEVSDSSRNLSAKPQDSSNSPAHASVTSAPKVPAVTQPSRPGQSSSYGASAQVTHSKTSPRYEEKHVSWAQVTQNKTSPQYEEKRSGGSARVNQTSGSRLGESRPNLMLKPGSLVSANASTGVSAVSTGHISNPSPSYGDFARPSTSRSMAAGTVPSYQPTFSARVTHPLSKDLRPTQRRPSAQGRPFVQGRSPDFNCPAAGGQPPREVSSLSWIRFLNVILRWNPRWLVEKAKFLEQGMAVSPDLTKGLLEDNKPAAINPLVKRYVNFKEYSECFMLPLLLVETWEGCFNDWKNSKNCLSQKLLCNQQGQADKEMRELKLVGIISKQDRRLGQDFKDGDLVHVSLRRGKEHQFPEQVEEVMGYVDKTEILDHRHRVDVLCRTRPEFAQMRKPDSMMVTMTLKIRNRGYAVSCDHLVEIKEISSIVTTKRQFCALNALPRSPLCNDILRPESNQTFCDRAPSNIPPLQGQYNRSQSIAIATATKISTLPKEKGRICLLQGPPGTGKSHTIIGIIENILKAKGGKGRICLCAPSNAAVDELLRRLHRLKRDKTRSVNFVRLGKKNGIHPEIQQYSIDAFVEKNRRRERQDELMAKLPSSLREEIKILHSKIDAQKQRIETTDNHYQRQKLRNDLKKLSRNLEDIQNKYLVDQTNFASDLKLDREMRKKVLYNANVIAGTLSSFGTSVIRNFQGNFDCVIIDEATQALELDTLIPLQYGATKLILVGDQEQLAPTVLSKVAKDNKLDLSLFERLYDFFSDNVGGATQSPVILLDTQYRMSHEIAQFPSNYIYEGKLLTDQSVLNRPGCDLEPYILFDIQEGQEQFSQTSSSMCNLAEAYFTAELCSFIVKSSRVLEKVVGIITAYAKQRKTIEEELQKMGLHQVEVSTVDGFQGQEKHVIIMSCVRANDTGNVGFVGNRNRMNVALTRAKHAMYLVGHLEVLDKNDEWNALLADAKDRKKIITVNTNNWKKAISSCLKKKG